MKELINRLRTEETFNLAELPNTDEVSLYARRKRLDQIRSSLEIQFRDRRAYYRARLWLIAIAIPALLLGNAAYDVAGLIAFVTALACLVIVAAYGYSRLGDTGKECIQAALQSNEPAAAGCTAVALRRAHMPAKTHYLEAIEGLVARLRRTEWEMMTRAEVEALVACVTDSNHDWAMRIGLPAIRSAAAHGETRAIPRLRIALSDLVRRDTGSIVLRGELGKLLINLELQAAKASTTNTLLRPAEGEAHLLRAAADSNSAFNANVLVRPATVMTVDDRTGIPDDTE